MNDKIPYEQKRHVLHHIFQLQWTENFVKLECVFYYVWKNLENNILKWYLSIFLNVNR